jgi:hypothetical protein
MYRTYKALEPIKEKEVEEKGPDGWILSGKTRIVKKAPTPEELEIKTLEQRSWLTYWTAYGAFSAAESITSFFFSWIPLYGFFKLATLIWLQAPIHAEGRTGAMVIYNRIIHPLLLSYEIKIDEAFKAGIEYAKSKKRELYQFAVRDLPGLTKDLWTSFVEFMKSEHEAVEADEAKAAEEEVTDDGGEEKKDK